ncbi:hypothetical protein E0L36_17600 [Streptomyces sp. AJS327]|uniref:WD40 repeat domain-containing protein n=1 Tax=Streptomyces sp. AJS327 TaxID=2545265 RepID=UPI0015DE863F|nr:hypothetical protein [Streptomyces sp. AJS327]MBA0052635.1 hypothetical protein [Streptomyces sp. AJS327]
MTDLYGVRVLATDSPNRRVRLRVTVLYYDLDSHIPLVDDASFFLRVLAEGDIDTPIGKAMSLDQRLDPNWVDAHTRWFVESMECVATRNHPFTDDAQALLDENYTPFPWELGTRFDQMPEEEAAALARAEELRVGADYDVVVTDPRWMAHLTPGDWWRTSAYATRADWPLDGEAEEIPDLRRPTVELRPFDADDTPRHAEFSDDGRFLAVSSGEGALVVYSTDSWSECLRVPSTEYLSPWLMWVPGEPVVTLRHHEEFGPQLAYDVTSGDPVEAPPQTGRRRSATGRYRAEGASGPAVALLSPQGEERVLSLREAVNSDEGEPEFLGPDPYDEVAFSSDESRVFVGCGELVCVVDPASGHVLRTVANDRLGRSLAVSPDGGYLAVGEKPSEGRSVLIRRVSDGRIVTCRAFDGQFLPAHAGVAWSPENRWLAVTLPTADHGGIPNGGEIRVFPVGLPREWVPDSERSFAGGASGECEV